MFQPMGISGLLIIQLVLGHRRPAKESFGSLLDLLEIAGANAGESPGEPEF